MEDTTYDYRTDTDYAVENGIVDAPEVWGVQPELEETWDPEEGSGSLPFIGIIDTIDVGEDSVTVQYGADGINVWSTEMNLKAQFSYNDLIQVALREMNVHGGIER